VLGNIDKAIGRATKAVLLSPWRFGWSIGMSALLDPRWERCDMLWISPGLARPKTLIPIDFGTKSTYKHAHIIKIHSSFFLGVYMEKS
jgi:hypothetical protein